MSKYTSRETLYTALQSTPVETWNNWILSLTTTIDDAPDLYHISFNINLPRHVIPQMPFAVGDAPHKLYHEPLPPRISTSSTILGCWRGIYANYSTLLEDHDDVECVRVYVYKVLPDKTAKILTPDVATTEWLLYDAHVTNEYSVFGSARLVKLGYIDIENTTKSPDRDWDKFYPYSLKKYTMLFSNPPFRILKSTLANSITLEEYRNSSLETNMSDTIASQIADKNEHHLEVIAMEAIGNPLSAMSDIIKRSLHSVVSNVPSFNPKHKKQNELGDIVRLFHETTQSEVLKNVNHLEIRNINVVVPVGFTGDYLGYFNVLSKQMAVMQNINIAVIEPTHNLILKYIGKPDSMSTIDNSDLDKIKLHTAEIEKFKSEMSAYFDPKRAHQTLPIGKLVNNTKDLQQLVSNVRNDLLPWMLDHNWRNSVFKSYSKLQASLDLLLVRIEQKPEEYSLTKLNAERLARLINDVAVEIELTGALFIYINQLIDCIINLQLAIYSDLED